MRLVANDCQQLKKFEGETDEALFRYLWVVSCSVAIDHYRYLRRQRRRQTTDRFQLRYLADRIGLNRDDLKIETSILMQEIMQIAESLLQEEIAEPETRDRYLLMFKLYIFEGFSLSQISDYCGVNTSKQAIDKIILKITKGLKEKLAASRG